MRNQTTYLLLLCCMLASTTLFAQENGKKNKNKAQKKETIIDFENNKDTVRFEIEPVKFNTKYAEIAPTFYKQTLLYSVIKSVADFKHEKLRWSKNPNISPYYIPHPDSVNQTQQIQTATSESWHFNSGIVTAIPNTEKIIFTRSLHKKTTFGNFFRKSEPERVGLYQATSNGQVWFNLSPIFPLDTLNYSEAHPTITDDGRTLYFVSDMEGGFGGSDVYISTKDSAGFWTKPVNLGSKINSAANEMYPFIHEDGTLYFASNREGGFGGYDIYEAIWNGEEFVKVVNMGIPTNSPKDDISFIVNEPKRICYLSSNRDGGEGSFDIYKMTVKLLNISRNITDGGENVFGIMNIPISGQILDSVSNQPVKRAMVKIRDYNNDDIQVAFADNKGFYKFVISNDNKFQISSSRIGYHSSLDYQFSTYGLTTPAPLSIDVNMRPVVYTVTLDVSIIETSNSLESNILAISDAKLILKETESNKTVEQRTDKNGNYKFILEQGKSYLLMVSKEGYESSIQQSISTAKRHNSEKIEINIPLTRMVKTVSKDFIIKAVVKDRDSKKNIANAIVILKNIQTQELSEKITDENGIAMFEVDTTHSYVLESIKDKYQLDNYVHILPKGMQTGVMVENILPMRAVTYTVVPENFSIAPLYYSSGKTDFDADFIKHLDEVYELLQKYKSLKISIVGHTDSNGSKENNLLLSQKRANTAQHYLTKKGLPKYRIISIIGVGNEKPVEKCEACTEEQNRKNRRTEFVIIEK